MTILIIAGEISGDRYAAELAKRLKTQSPDVHLIGIGGDLLEKEVQQFISPIAKHHVIGISEKWKTKEIYTAFMKDMDALLESATIDKAVIIDFQHHNFKIAEKLKAKHIPITSFITPNYWIWGNEKEIQKTADYSHDIVCIFEKEYTIYKKLNPNTYYFGHPILNLITPCKRNPNPTKQHLTLYPGSRASEIKNHLPIMLKSIQIVQEHMPELTITITLSDRHFEERIRHYLDIHPIKNVTCVTRDQAPLDTTNLIVCVAGTSTLETIIHRIPMIVVGRISRLSYTVARFMLGINPRFITLPNIIMNREMVPELKQYDMTPKNLARKIVTYLNEDNARILVDQYTSIERHLKKDPDPIAKTAELLRHS